MTTVLVQFRCRRPDVRSVRWHARNHSGANYVNGILSLKYICETDDTDAAIAAVHDDIDLQSVESLGCELVAIS